MKPVRYEVNQEQKHQHIKKRLVDEEPLEESSCNTNTEPVWRKGIPSGIRWSGVEAKAHLQRK